jgi:hypothetical protein
VAVGLGELEQVASLFGNKTTQLLICSSFAVMFIPPTIRGYN